jgi:hypothetical protein
MKVHWDVHIECYNTPTYWIGEPKCQYCGDTMEVVKVPLLVAKDYLPLCDLHNNWDTIHDMHDAGEPLPYAVDKVIQESYSQWRSERIPQWIDQQLRLS